MKKPLTVSTERRGKPKWGENFIFYYIAVCGKHNEENGEDRNQAIVDNLAENTRAERKAFDNKYPIK